MTTEQEVAVLKRIVRDIVAIMPYIGTRGIDSAREHQKAQDMYQAIIRGVAELDADAKAKA